jgi:hypothetical protein
MKKTLKLELNRETIRSLQDSLQMGQVGGGGGVVSGFPCNTRPLFSCVCSNSYSCP